jgi:peptide/nickel transport system substrate-binding protein
MASNRREGIRVQEEIMRCRCNAPRSTRRSLLAGAMAAGAGLMLPRAMFAQDGTPVAGQPIRTKTRQELVAEIEQEEGYTTAETSGGTFVDSNVNDIQTIHPLIADDGDSLGVVSMLYDSLVGGDIRTGQPAPLGLADQWEIASDDRTYTFFLNKDAKWHDGTPITAADVQFTFDSLKDPDLGSSYSQSFLESTESWRIIDDHTFEVVAKEPLVTFLYDMFAIVIPKHIWESVPVKDWRTDGGATGQDPSRVVGSGAFKFQEWKQGESITLVRNDDYYQKVPYIDSYVIRIWPDQTAVLNGLLNAEIDVAALQPADVETVKGTEGLMVATYPTRSFTYYMTNMDPAKTELFGDTPVRQALLHGLDRDSIVNNIWLGFAEVARGTQPVISYAYAPDQIKTVYNYDPEKAKSLLAEAGWTDTNGDGIVDKDGKPFSFEMIYGSGSPTVDQLVAYMQDAWKAIGVEMTPRAMEFSALVEVITGDHNFDVAMLAFSWDASFIQDAMFGCNQYEGGFNMVKYCNPKVDEINNTAKRTFEEDERAKLIIEATNIVNDDLPVAVMHFSKANVGFSDRLQNFKPSAWGVDTAYVWIKQ